MACLWRACISVIFSVSNNVIVNEPVKSTSHPRRWLVAVLAWKGRNCTLGVNSCVVGLACAGGWSVAGGAGAPVSAVGRWSAAGRRARQGGRRWVSLEEAASGAGRSAPSAAARVRVARWPPRPAKLPIGCGLAGACPPEPPWLRPAVGRSRPRPDRERRWRGCSHRRFALIVLPRPQRARTLTAAALLCLP